MSASGTESPEVVREAFTLTRAAEYLSVPELEKQSGYPFDLWFQAIIKELIDNALDHLEEIERLPEITVTLAEAGIKVEDNGDGIPAEVVEKMLDFNTRVSSREAYRCLTRGTQGNAGKVLCGMPYVINKQHGHETGRTTIIAKGVKHDIVVGVDSLTQQPQVTHTTEPAKVQIGTSAEVHFAQDAGA